MNDDGKPATLSDVAELGRERRSLVSEPIETGRMGVYTALGAMAGSVPLPWVPSVFARRIRGALLHDIAARHDVALTPEARDVLADPNRASNTALKQFTRFAVAKVLTRFGPLGVLPTLRTGLGTFVLGRLFDRYLDARRERSVRLDVLEARRVRALIDQAIVHAMTADVPSPKAHHFVAPDELRDAATQFIDGVVIAAAGVPSYLVRRLDASFDDLLALEPH